MDKKTDRDGSLKLLQLLAAISAGVDTHKNLPFAGEQGREKYKNTRFDNAESIMENAVEGTDVMENAGMEPGTFGTYAAGNAYDVLNPVNMALAGLTKVGGAAGKLAKILTLSETAAEGAGKYIVKKNLPTYIERNLRNIKDIPMSKRIAEEAMETGADKVITNPKKALEIIKGSKDQSVVAKEGKLKLWGQKRKEGTIDKVGKDIDEVILGEAPTAGTVNKGAIHRKELGKVKNHNTMGIGYEKDLNSHDEILRKALSPYETVEEIKVIPPKLKMKDASGDDLIPEIAELEKKIAASKAERSAYAQKKMQIDKTVKESSSARSAAEKRAEEENTKAIAEMLEDEARLDELNEVLEMRKSRPKPQNPIAIPKTRKDGQPLSMKTKLDLEKKNKEIAKANDLYKKLQESDVNPVQVRREIEAIKKKTYPDYVSADDLAPPAVSREMLDELPPPAPGLEEMLSALGDKRNKKAMIDSKNKEVDLFNKSQKPTVEKISREVDLEAPIDEILEKKRALREEFKQSTYGKPLAEWTPKDKILESVIERLDDEIIKRLSESGQIKYLAGNQKYSSQSKLADIFEDQIQSETKAGGRAAQMAAESSAGGAFNPAAVGRMAKGAVDAMTGPKRRIQFGNFLRNRKWQMPLHEGASEIIEIPYDPDYLEDRTKETEDAEIDFSGVPEMPKDSSVEAADDGRMPAGAVEIPEAAQVADEMSPEVDFSDVPSLGIEGGESPETAPDIHQKIDDTLAPQGPQFDAYMNEELLNTILPRDTKRLLANPRALIAKLQQAAPDKVPMLQDMMENDPEGLEEAAPMLAQMFPAMFERDKYGMFDGKIVDPMMQQKFLADLYQDESMDSIKKAELSSKIKRGASIYS